MELSRIEQETIITYNAAEDLAEIYSCYPPMIRKLEKLAVENPEEWKLLRETPTGKTFTFPKGLITLRRKGAKRELTSKEKEAARIRGERLQKARRLRSED